MIFRGNVTILLILEEEQISVSDKAKIISCRPYFRKTGYHLLQKKKVHFFTFKEERYLNIILEMKSSFHM